MTTLKVITNFYHAVNTLRYFCRVLKSLIRDHITGTIKALQSYFTFYALSTGGTDEPETVTTRDTFFRVSTKPKIPRDKLNQKES